MSENFQKERRKHLRVPVKFLPLIDISPNDDPKLIFQGNIVEISEGGLLIQLPNLDISSYIPPVKQTPLTPEGLYKLWEFKVWLNFSLPQHKNRIKVQAQLMRVSNRAESHQLALKFLDITSPERETIRDFVNSTVS